VWRTHVHEIRHHLVPTQTDNPGGKEVRKKSMDDMRPVTATAYETSRFHVYELFDSRTDEMLREVTSD
jgi:hypothetical protein